MTGCQKNLILIFTMSLRLFRLLCNERKAENACARRPILRSRPIPTACGATYITDPRHLAMTSRPIYWPGLMASASGALELPCNASSCSHKHVVISVSKSADIRVDDADSKTSVTRFVSSTFTNHRHLSHHNMNIRSTNKAQRINIDISR